jgi:hypothetical protein
MKRILLEESQHEHPFQTVDDNFEYGITNHRFNDANFDDTRRHSMPDEVMT